jgi:hypothetical protein
VRGAVLLAALLVCAGCGGAAHEPSHSHAAKAPTTRCSHSSRGFRACTVFRAPGERSALYRRTGSGWVVVQGRLPGRVGWWRRVVSAPDRRTLLAQWSGECELQSTFLVSVHDGRVRPVFRGHAATPAGWTQAGMARVRLADRIWRGKHVLRQTGLYLVDPRTMAVKLERREPVRSGC